MPIHGLWMNHGWRSVRCQPEITSSNELQGFYMYPCKNKNTKIIEMHIYYIYNYDYVQFIASFSYIFRVYHRAFIVRQAWGYRGTRDVLIRGTGIHLGPRIPYKGASLGFSKLSLGTTQGCSKLSMNQVRTRCICV